ncbi:hypothetical protein [Nostoc sp.]|uniref:hypothetical protein n=1 Tax=Nostoc sp. TaxID=1180 RepID=UPI002FFC01B3
MSNNFGFAIAIAQPLVEKAVACGKWLRVYVKKIDFDKELSLNPSVLGFSCCFLLTLQKFIFKIESGKIR